MIFRELCCTGKSNVGVVRGIELGDATTESVDGLDESEPALGRGGSRGRCRNPPGSVASGRNTAGLAASGRLAGTAGSELRTEWWSCGGGPVPLINFNN